MMNEGLTVRLKNELMRHRGTDGIWEGALSSSALATATSAFALHQHDPAAHCEHVRQAIEWLTRHVNADGGWGDTTDSPSNLSTSLLCRAAIDAIAGHEARLEAPLSAATRWVAAHVGALDSTAIAMALRRCYGHDRTFAAPILAMLAMATTGQTGEREHAWRHVPQLPFELACLPPGSYRRVRLSVVSYALPALIAIGLARHRHKPSAIPGLAALRDRLSSRVLARLTELQPSHGGFLDASPLTAFVAMALCAAGEADHPVTLQAINFLTATIRPDGSWPIDAHLRIWVTTQAVAALGTLQDGAFADHADRARVRRMLLCAQSRQTHAYTAAAPGGWSWTDRPGGVPDADDTAGALIALRVLHDPLADDEPEIRAGAAAGIRWLLGVRNRDGGWPTFCRGWGRLPFDRSCPDITAHALQALTRWQGLCDVPHPVIDTAIRRALRYLRHEQRPDGSWIPLWFGNQTATHMANPLYGTARVVAALPGLVANGYREDAGSLQDTGVRWLLANRDLSGGWGAEQGCTPTVEETALAVHALAACEGADDAVLSTGLAWIERALEQPDGWRPTPIGLYFARLWYSELLYPIVFALAAAGECNRSSER